MKNRKLPTSSGTTIRLVFLALVAVIVYAGVFSSGKTIQTTDFSLKWASFVHNELISGNWPDWSSFHLAGRPHQILFAGPSALLCALLPADKFIAAAYMLDIFLLGLWTYVLGRGLGWSKNSSLVAALAMELNCYLVSLSSAGHLGKFDTICWFPLAFEMIRRIVREKSITRRATASLGLGASAALMLIGGAVQIAYYLFIAMAAWWIWLLALEISSLPASERTSNIRTTVLLTALSAVLAAVLSAQVLVNYLGSDTPGAAIPDDPKARFAFNTSWSIPPYESIILAAPDFFGNSREGTYFGGMEHRISSEYLGGAVLLLALIGLLARPAQGRWFFSGLFIAGLLVSFGKYTPVYRYLILPLPGMNQFRVPSKALLLCSFAVSMLAGLGVQALHDSHRDHQLARRSGRIAIIIAIASGIVFLFFALFSRHGLGPDKALAMQRANHALGALTRGLIPLLAAAVTAFAITRSRQSETMRNLTLFLLVTIALDSGIEDSKFISFFETSRYAPETALSDRLSALKPDVRVKIHPASSRAVWSLGFNNLPMHGIDIYDISLSRLPEGYGELQSALGRLPKRFLEIFAISHVLSDRGFSDPLLVLSGIYPMEDISGAPLFGRKPDGTVPNMFLYRPASMIQRAAMYYSWQIIGDNKATTDILASPAHNPHASVVLGSDPGVKSVPGSSGSAKITDYGNESLTIDVKTGSPGVLVLRDYYAPAWRARIDGHDSAIIRADRIFRAVAVPAGHHTVHMEYLPGHPGIKLAMSGWILLGLGMITRQLISRRKRGHA